ncbi:MAG: hypothetical protein ACTSV2_14120, partial [Candidatus Thorarchaeota archaeon]
DLPEDVGKPQGVRGSRPRSYPQMYLKAQLVSEGVGAIPPSSSFLFLEIKYQSLNGSKRISIHTLYFHRMKYH